MSVCTGLVMAGGKGKRLGLGEKALVKVGGKRMIELVLSSLRSSEEVDDIYVAVSQGSKGTLDWCRKRGAKVVITSGKGYVHDLDEALSRVKLPCLVLPVDLPLIRPRTIRCFVKRARRTKADIVTLAVPAEEYLTYGSERSLEPIREGELLIQPTGIGYFRSRSGEWEVFVEGMRPEFVNVNTLEELIFANAVLSL